MLHHTETGRPRWGQGRSSAPGCPPGLRTMTRFRCSLKDSMTPPVVAAKNQQAVFTQPWAHPSSAPQNLLTTPRHAGFGPAAPRGVAATRALTLRRAPSERCGLPTVVPSGLSRGKEGAGGGLFAVGRVNLCSDKAVGLFRRNKNTLCRS